MPLDEPILGNDRRALGVGGELPLSAVLTPLTGV